MLTPLRITTLWLSVTAVSAALPVAIGDHSFEGNTLSQGGWSNELGPEWQVTGFAFEEWIAGFAADGTDHAGTQAGTTLHQDLGESYEANTRYTLTIAAGNRSGFTSAGNQTTYALADSSGTVYASAFLDASTIGVGSFADGPGLVFETGTAPSAVGKTIRVRLEAGGTNRSHFDNIRLEKLNLTPPGGATVENNPATGVTFSSATLHGEVTAIGSGVPAVVIFHGDENGGLDPGSWDQSVALPGTQSGSFSTNVAGLSPGTTYYFAARATNGAGDSWAQPAETFTTPNVPATVANLAASNLAAKTATVGADVTDTGGDPPAVTIYYGTADGGTVGGNWQASRSLGVLSGSATAPITNLAQNTTYYFRAFAQNSGGGAWAASSESFTTRSITAPVVGNNGATGVTGTSANLRGEITDDGLEAPFVTIFYGLTDGGATTNWDASVAVGIDSGAFTQFVGGLSPLTTYYFTARAVNEAGTVFATPSQSFTTTNVIPNNLVINEIHYDPEPKTELVEFIELYNAGASAANLSGWRFTAGVAFTFPPGTTVAPGEFAVVAADPAAFNAKFGFTPLGPWTGSLSNDGELIRLVDSGNVVQDEVDYGVGFPWPTGSLDSGKSIELINPGLDNDLGGNWRTGGESSGTGNTLMPIESVWKYFKGTAEPSTVTGAWRAISFADGSWLTGQGTIGYGEGAETLKTVLPDMQGGYSTLYLRHAFTVTNPAAVPTLVLRARFDDGFNAWINGTFIESSNVSAENLPNTATANGSGEDLSYREFPLANPQSFLVAGPNVIAVQLLNSSLASSSDAFWDAELVVAGGSSGLSPGVQNGSFTVNAPPAVRQVDHRPKEPASLEAVVITAKVTDPDGVQAVSLAYQVVAPGNYISRSDPAYENAANWTTVAMVDDGSGDDLFAGDDVFTATLPAGVQNHRTLVRYRITAEDQTSTAVQTPYGDDTQPNFAYYVYDGTPGWSGRLQPPAGAATTISPALLDSVPTYHLITRRPDHEDAQHIPNSSAGTYGGSEYLWEGTLVYDGRVYDHIRYRARGGVWRYSMGKNMWKFKFNDAHNFVARDNYGKKYPEPWRRLNFSAMIQQGDYQHRGEQGLFEGVGFRLFNLAGVEACRTHYVHFRIVENAAESGADQFGGDFQGIYLAIEQPDGRFLKAHNMPEANVFKMEGGGGELKYQAGPELPSNGSDLTTFLNTYGGGTQSDAWWEANFDLKRYYAYRTIVDGIHHYDIAGGKNYYYFHDAESGKWQVHPWDLDLTWANNMFGNGNEPFLSRVLAKPAFDLENGNAAREILDLLFNPDQAFRLIEEQMSFVYTAGEPSLVDADRFMWDYNPILTSSYVNSSKAGHGRFYQSAVSPGGFPGMAQKMKNYVVERRAWIASNRLNLTPPNPPTISYTGEAGYPITGLSFQTSAFSASGMSPAEIEWRIGEVYDPVNTPLDYIAKTPYLYEIEPVWATAPGAWGGGVTGQAVPASALTPGHTYRARVRHKATNGRWSSWSAPVEFVAGVADVGIYQAGLVISELMYHPKDATVTEIGAGYESSDFEFIELYNVGPVALDLTEVRFTDGIDFAFGGSALTAIAPGQRVLVVRNLAAFTSRYGSGLPVAGEFPGSSFSNDGERVELSIGLASTILAFTYNDQPPWPTGADDGVNGFPLVLIDPGSLPDHDFAGSWTAGEAPGGNPGGPDLLGITAWIAGFGILAQPADDYDGDGLVLLLEYVLAGGSPLVPNSTTLPILTVKDYDVGGGFQSYGVFEFRIRAGLSDVAINVETSTDLNGWTSPGTMVLHEQINNGDGTITLRYRTADSMAVVGERLFARISVTLNGP